MSEKISEQVSTLEQITITDELTGLFNRKHLFAEGLRYVHMSRRTDIPLSCLMIDIDYFKSVNDTYGHSFGDGVLKAVAEEIRNSVRESDLPVRYGGEEFTVLAYKADTQQAVHLAERLRSAIEARSFTFEHAGPAPADEGVRLTVSIGVAALEEQFEGMVSKPRVREALDGLLGRADEALYRAKDEGRNRTVLWRPQDE
jgi:diguanylate cyclase (GGDEF)-like protein